MAFVSDFERQYTKSLAELPGFEKELLLPTWRNFETFLVEIQRFGLSYKLLSATLRALLKTATDDMRFLGRVTVICHRIRDISIATNIPFDSAMQDAVNNMLNAPTGASTLPLVAALQRHRLLGPSHINRIMEFFLPTVLASDQAMVIAFLARVNVHCLGEHGSYLYSRIEDRIQQVRIVGDLNILVPLMFGSLMRSTIVTFSQCTRTCRTRHRATPQHTLLVRWKPTPLLETLLACARIPPRLKMPATGPII